MAMDEKGLGKRLQRARQAAGMTQQALCHKANLSYSTLTKIERGAIKSPSIFTIQNIADALSTSLDELLGRPVQSKVIKRRQQSIGGVSFVYFDINGCLVRFYHRAFIELAKDCGKAPDTVETAFWHYNDKACRGEMSVEQFNQALADRLGVASVDWRQYYLGAIEPMPAMAKLIHWADEHYGVGLLTNIMSGFVNEMRSKNILPQIAYDAIVDSSEVHAIKPEPKMYEIAEKRAGADPAEILLVDDSRVNLMAAEKRGWKVMWFDDFRPDESAERIKEALRPAKAVSVDSTGLQPASSLA